RVVHGSRHRTETRTETLRGQRSLFRRMRHSRGRRRRLAPDAGLPRSPLRCENRRKAKSCCLPPIVSRSKGVGLRLVAADYIEALDAIPLGPVVVFSHDYFHTATNAARERLVELLKIGDAEFTEVSLRHWHRSRREPDVVPNESPGEFAFENFEREL